MKRIVIGTGKSYFYNFNWFASKNKKTISETIKTYKTKGFQYAINVKGNYQKQSVFSVAGVKDKESKADLKLESPVAALVLNAFYKRNKKPDSINFDSHQIKYSGEEKAKKFDFSKDETAKNWIVMFTAEEKGEEKNDNGYWLAIITDGEPHLKFFDKFYTSNDGFRCQGEIIEELQDFMEDSEDRSKEYLFISDREDVLSNFEHFFYQSEKLKNKAFESALVGFDTFIENIKPPQINKISTTIIDPKYIVGLVAIAGIGYGGLQWMDYMEEQEMLEQSMRSKQKTEKTKEENLQMQKEYEELKIKVLQETLEEANKELNDKISVGDPVMTISDWIDVVYKVKLNHSGWLLKTIDCSIVKEKTKCTVELNRDKLGLNKNLILNYPKANISGEKATYILEGDDKINYERQDYLTLPDIKSFLIDTQSSLQKLTLGGVNYSIGASSEITKEVVLPEPPSKVIMQDMNIAPIKMGVEAGTLKLSGKGAYLLNGLKDWINDPTLKVEKMKITVDNNGIISWDISGYYFIKKADKPTLPEIPPSTIAGVDMRRSR